MDDRSAGPLLVAAGLVWRPGPTLLLQRRPAGASHGAGCWELPGGKLERGEHPRDALVRELHEEWGPAASSVRVGPVAEVLHHRYPAPGPEVLLVVYHVDAGPLGPREVPVEGLGLRPEPGVRLGAFGLADLPVGQCLAADRGLLAAVRDGRLTPPAP